MKHLIANFIAFQIGWFSCVLGAAFGYPVTGALVTLVVVAIHLHLSKRPKSELRLLIVAAVCGVFFDTLLVQSGWLTYPNGELISGTAPYWIIAMWVLFATTLNVSLRWLRDRLALAIAMGAIGGPLSYLAGERLGGLTFADQNLALIALAIGWGFFVPVLVHIAKANDGISDLAESIEPSVS